MSVEDKVVEEVVEQTKPTSHLKKVIKFIITFKFLLELIMLISKLFLSIFNQARRATLLQLDDDSWKTVLWIKFWYLVFGLLGGVYLQSRYGLIDKAIDLIEAIT